MALHFSRATNHLPVSTSAPETRCVLADSYSVRFNVRRITAFRLSGIGAKNDHRVRMTSISGSVHAFRNCCSYNDRLRTSRRFICGGPRMRIQSSEHVESSDLIQLLAAAKAGSREALGSLLDQHRDYLLLIANEELNRNGIGALSPSDVVQRTQLEAVHDFQGFRGTSASELRSWLRRILVHNLTDETRRRAPRSADPGNLIVEGPSPSSLAAANEAVLQLQSAIRSLPDDERTLIELHYFHNKSYAEISNVIGRTPEATRKLWARAIVRLKSFTRELT